MNGLLANVAQFWEQLLVEGATFMQTQQDKIDAGKFKLDEFTQDSATLWLKNSSNLARLVGTLSGMRGSTVVLLLPAGSSNTTPDQVLVAPTIGLGTVKTSELKAITGSGTGDLTATLTGFDVLTVTAKNVAGTAKGDMLVGLVYVLMNSGKAVPLAKVFVVIT